jgi:hypothetical protein
MLKERPQWDVLQILALDGEITTIRRYPVHEGQIRKARNTVRGSVDALEGIGIDCDVFFVSTYDVQDVGQKLLRGGDISLWQVEEDLVEQC